MVYMKPEKAILQFICLVFINNNVWLPISSYLLINSIQYALTY